MTLDRATDDQSTAPVALFINAQLFDGEPFNDEYGPTVKRVVLDVILTLDPHHACRFQTWWGSLMLPVFRPASADSDGTLTMDLDLFLLWTSASNLCRDADARWVIPAATVPWLLGNNRIYLGVISNLPAALHEPLHQALNAHPWYVGMMAVNPADPLHHRVFSLIPGWRYNQGWIDDAPEHLNPREVFHGLPVIGYGPGPTPLRARDVRVPWDLITPTTDANPQTYQEALIALLADYTQAERSLVFTAGRKHPVVNDLHGKLHGYALNPTHEKGAAKATFFRTALGLEQEDWRLLAIQLISALTASDPAKFRDEPRFGQRQHLRFEITAPVLGLNGRTGMVTSAWKIEDDGPVQLVTLTPGKKQGVVERDQALEAGNWAALYAIAVEVAEQARRNCRPTPLAFTGGPGVEVIAEGAAGFAWVIFSNPATPFVAWLLAQGHVLPDEVGATICAPTFDYEPAIAWAEAFAAVLQAAGHDCTVTHTID
ncbi:DUF6883 domain-containing protein [Micromonospora sp. DT62]|uniref:DUF6883 domain-containing protein n=1 Tax=Micromonospora sp. DT62 TaxID=3416521 RepID=UPI003CED5058